MLGVCADEVDGDCDGVPVGDAVGVHTLENAKGLEARLHTLHALVASEPPSGTHCEPTEQPHVRVCVVASTYVQPSTPAAREHVPVVASHVSQPEAHPHGVHSVDPAAENVPAGHTWHI